MHSCKDTCDDLPVGRPATGRTPLRNHRSHNVVWLPALARTVAEDTTVTDFINEALSEYGSTPLTRSLTFRHWPEAAPWLDAHYPAWPELAAALQAAAPGLADADYIGVAVWLAITRRRADRKLQQHIIAGFLLQRAITGTADGWREKYDDTEALLTAINQVLDEQLPGRQPPWRRSRTRAAGGSAAPARRRSSGR
jgi:hypothetical protein